MESNVTRSESKPLSAAKSLRTNRKPICKAGDSVGRKRQVNARADGHKAAELLLFFVVFFLENRGGSDGVILV